MVGHKLLRHLMNHHRMIDSWTQIACGQVREWGSISLVEPLEQLCVGQQFVLIEDGDHPGFLVVLGDLEEQQRNLIVPLPGLVFVFFFVLGCWFFACSS